jgi:hypothetical protein
LPLKDYCQFAFLAKQDDELSLVGVGTLSKDTALQS